MVLKCAGEYGDDPPPQLLGVCAISPAVDPAASVAAIMLPSNWIYHWDFVRRLRKRIYTKHKLFPDLYDINRVSQVRTLRDFDECYTSKAHGFADADDYYQKSGSLNVIKGIRIPTLILHAEDDPFIPFFPLLHPSVSRNPYVFLVATKRGGHVAFVSQKKDYEDRFWGENRVIEFCKLANESL